MKDIIKEAKELTNTELLIVMLYATYFASFAIGFVNRIVKEIKENEKI